MRIVLTSNLKVLEALETEIAALEKDLNLLGLTPCVELLLGIPGIDVLSALTILAEIGHFKQLSPGGSWPVLPAWFLRYTNQARPNTPGTSPKLAAACCAGYSSRLPCER